MFRRTLNRLVKQNFFNIFIGPAHNVTRFQYLNFFHLKYLFFMGHLKKEMEFDKNYYGTERDDYQHALFLLS